MSVDGIVESTTGGFQFADGSIQTTAGPRSYAQRVVVAQSGGDFTSVQAAIDSITDASATKPYLVLIGPGDYAEQVTMAPWIDLEGAGEGVSVIRDLGASADDTGTVVCSDDAELRFLSVENTGTDAYANAIYCSGTSPRITHVTAVAFGGTAASNGVRITGGAAPTLSEVTATATGGNDCRGMHVDGASAPVIQDSRASCTGGFNGYGVHNDSASPEMTRMAAVSDGAASINYGVFNEDASPVMNRVEALGSGGDVNAIGLYNKNGSEPVARYCRFEGEDATLGNYGVYNSATQGALTVRVSHSQVFGATATVRNDAEFTTRVTSSLLDGGAVDVSAGGTVTCILAYDEAFTVPSPAGACP